MNLSGFGAQQQLPPLSTDEFQTDVVDLYGGDVHDAIEAAVDDVWPVGMHEGEPVHRAEVDADLDPSFREHQKEAVVEVIENLYVEDKDVVTLSAPTGAGKSLILYAVVEVLNVVGGRRTFSTTPLNALVDQMDSDEFLSEVITIKGKNNYDCIHPHDKGTSVDNAVCQRVSDFDCEYKERGDAFMASRNS